MRRDCLNRKKYEASPLNIVNIIRFTVECSVVNINLQTLSKHCQFNAVVRQMTEITVQFCNMGIRKYYLNLNSIIR